jgi:hypothetical protein
MVTLATLSFAQREWKPGNADNRLVRTRKEQVDFSRWHGKTVVNYTHPLTNWVPTLPPIGYTNLQNDYSETHVYNGNVMRQAGFTVHTVPGTDYLSVLTRVWPSVENTQEYMVVNMSHPRLSRGTIVNGQGHSVRCGDKWFGYFDQDRERVWFSRNNVCVIISAYASTNSNRGLPFSSTCLSLATNLDAQILRLSVQ